MHLAPTTGPLAPYTRYAALYDRLGQGQWSEQLVRFTLDTLLPRYGRRPRRALDLACGTGAAALSLARAGLAVTGLDGAPAMLAVARAKARAAGLAIDFVQGDLRAGWVAGREGGFDLVTCCYDSLNYLLDPADLAGAFATIRRALAPGGLLVCDLTTASAYRGADETRAWSLDLDEVGYSLSTTWDEGTRRATTTICCAMRAASGAESFCERHEQRAYERDEVEAALAAGGLRLLDVYGATPLRGPTTDPPPAQAARLVYVAERRRLGRGRAPVRGGRGDAADPLAGRAPAVGGFPGGPATAPNGEAHPGVKGDPAARRSLRPAPPAGGARTAGPSRRACGRALGRSRWLPGGGALRRYVVIHGCTAVVPHCRPANGICPAPYRTIGLLLRTDRTS